MLHNNVNRREGGWGGGEREILIQTGIETFKTICRILATAFQTRGDNSFTFFKQEEAIILQC